MGQSESPSQASYSDLLLIHWTILEKSTYLWSPRPRRKNWCEVHRTAYRQSFLPNPEAHIVSMWYPCYFKYNSQQQKLVWRMKDKMWLNGYMIKSFETSNGTYKEGKSGASSLGFSRWVQGTLLVSISHSP